MLLIHLLKILFCLLLTRYVVKWVSYHWHHRNKKARVFHGNCRLPMGIELALLYGLKSKTKIRYKDLSYRKNLVEWWCILNSLYPPDNLIITPPSHANSNSNLTGDLGVTIGNRKRKPFPQFKTGNTNFIRIKKIYNVITAKLCAKNNNVVSSFLLNTKIINFNNLKIPKNAIPFPKQTFRMHTQIFTVCFHFISFPFHFSFIIKPVRLLSNHQIIKSHLHIFHFHPPLADSNSQITLSSIALQLIEYKQVNVVKFSSCVKSSSLWEHFQIGSFSNFQISFLAFQHKICDCLINN